MKAVIIEDEVLNARKLKRLLESEHIEVLATLESLEQARIWLDENAYPAIFFMDIELSDGLVFELFDTHRITTPIIFTTAYDQYALEAFRHYSVDYLLKPISKEKLQQALDKYSAFKASANPNLQLIGELIRERLTQDYKSRFSIRVGQRIRWYSTNEISCFYSEGKSTFLYTDEGRSYPVEYSLTELESLLNPTTFFRINRKYLLQIDAITEIIRVSPSKWKVQIDHFTKEDLYVSRDRVKEFKSWLG